MSLADKIARLQKAKEAEKRVKEGGPLKIKSAISEIGRMKKAAAKANEAYIKEVMESRGEILKGFADYKRVQENEHVRERAVNELREFFQRDIDTELELLEAEKFKLVVMDELADADIDNLIDAKDAEEAFNEALRNYTISVLESGDEIDEDEVKAMWQRIVGDKHTSTLQRGTTIFFTVDMHFQQAIAAWKNGDVVSWKEEFITRLQRIGEIFNIPESVMLDIESL